MTPLLSWKPDYSVNEERFDNHHIRLFEILNMTYENVMNSPKVDNVLPIIDELSQYTNCYFTEEEQRMRERGSQDIDAHIAKHREFSQTIESLKSNVNGKNLEVTQELIILLGNWLLKHVLTEDRKQYEVSADIKV